MCKLGSRPARYAGRPDACEAFSFAGMTDRAIIRAGIEALGREVTEGACRYCHTEITEAIDHRARTVSLATQSATGAHAPLAGEPISCIRCHTNKQGPFVFEHAQLLGRIGESIVSAEKRQFTHDRPS